jgi:hypothetical protein
MYCIVLIDDDRQITCTWRAKTIASAQAKLLKATNDFVQARCDEGEFTPMLQYAEAVQFWEGQHYIVATDY